MHEVCRLGCGPRFDKNGDHHPKGVRPGSVGIALLTLMSSCQALSILFLPPLMCSNARRRSTLWSVAQLKRIAPSVARIVARPGEDAGLVAALEGLDRDTLRDNGGLQRHAHNFQRRIRRCFAVHGHA